MRATAAGLGSIPRHPAQLANRARNRLGDDARLQRWRGARDELWRLLDPLLHRGSRVAVVGAGNGHDVPLRRLAERAAGVTLVDVDRRAALRARARLPATLRGRVGVIRHDVTGGAADTVVRAAIRARVPDRLGGMEAPLPGAPFDVVVGDLLYSQLLYPALLDHRVDRRRARCFLERYGPVLARGVVARLHVSAPHGPVVHLHDPLGWWPGRLQPVTLPEILQAAGADTAAALRLIARASGPQEADPRGALAHFGIRILDTRLWRWPFAPGVDYLVCATVAA